MKYVLVTVVGYNVDILVRNTRISEVHAVMLQTPKCDKYIYLLSEYSSVKVISKIQFY
jgi:hypothetical protein